MPQNVDIWCPRCKIKMKVQNVYRATGYVKTQRLVCPKCYMTGCAVVVSSVVFDPPRDTGACATAKKIREHKLPVPEIVQGKFPAKVLTPPAD